MLAIENFANVRPSDAEASAYALDLLQRYRDIPRGADVAAHVEPCAYWGGAVTVHVGAFAVDVWFERHADGSGRYLYGEY